MAAQVMAVMAPPPPAASAGVAVWAAAGLTALALLAAAAAAAAWWAGRDRRALRARLRATAGGRAPDPVDALLLADARVAAGPAAALARGLARLLPPAWRDARAAGRLAAAGFTDPRAPYLFAAARLTAPALAPALAWLAFGRPDPLPLGLALAAGLVGPAAVVDRRAGARRVAISRGVPDALDLMVVCLEAGVGTDAALARVAREIAPTHPALAAELDDVTRRVGAGLPREDALRGLAARDPGGGDLRGAVSVMVQAERLGTSLARVLRIQSEGVRLRRRQSAEKRAAEASVKMLVPLVLFLLPAFFVVVIGPAAMSMVATFRQP